MSVIPPKQKDDIETQFDHSQVYLYELNAQKQATKRPRHVMPYAVITWLKFNDGTEWPQYFDEPGSINFNILATDSLQLALKTTEDVYLQTKLKALLKLNQLSTIQPTNGENHKTNGTNGITNGNHCTNGSLTNSDQLDKPNGDSNEKTETLTEPKNEPETPVNGLPVNGDTTAPLVQEEMKNDFKTENHENVEKPTNGINESAEEHEATDKTNNEQQAGSGEPTVGASNPKPISPNTEAVAAPVSSPSTTVPTSTTPSTIVPATTTTTAASAAAAVAATPTISPLQAHKTSLVGYNKPAYSGMYRSHQPGYLMPLHGAQFHPYSANMNYHQRQMLLQQQQQALQLQQLAALQGGQLGGQPGQMVLVRGPNGIQYLSHAGSGGLQQAQYSSVQQQQQQMLMAQVQAQAQAQALQQQQAQLQHQYLLSQSQATMQYAQLQQQQSNATYTAGPTQYKQGKLN